MLLTNKGLIILESSLSLSICSYSCKPQWCLKVTILSCELTVQITNSKNWPVFCGVLFNSLFFGIFLTDCSAIVHKGCKESFASCAKVKMKVRDFIYSTEQTKKFMQIYNTFYHMAQSFQLVVKNFSPCAEAFT